MENALILSSRWLQINIPCRLNATGYFMYLRLFRDSYLIKRNSHFQTKIKKIFFDRVFILKAGKNLVANLWTNLPFGFTYVMYN